MTDEITYQFISLDDIDKILGQPGRIDGTFMELLEENNCCLHGDRDLIDRIDELFSQSTRKKDIDISPEITESDKKYNAKRILSTTTTKQKEKKEQDDIDLIITSKYIKYLATFIIFNKDIPYVYTKDIITELTEDCSALKRCETQKEIAQIINDEIYNNFVWEYIIINKLVKENLNDINECILSILEQLKTIDSTMFWLISRINLNGKQQFLNDIQKLKPELYDTFKSINIPESDIQIIMNKKKK